MVQYYNIIEDVGDLQDEETNKRQIDRSLKE
jgi:hypothetical protein